MANERQIPKSKDYLKNPLYWDIIYGYIQTNSEWDGVYGHPRILPKAKANFSKIGKELGVSRQTVSKRFLDLGGGQNPGSVSGAGLNLIRKLDNGDYELTILDKEIATLIDNNVLRTLTNTCNDNTISIYVYLYSRWKASQCQPFIFTYEQLKTIIGLGTKGNGNNYIIKDILNVLCLIGLLEITVDIGITDAGGYQTRVTAVQMNDTISSPVDEALAEWKKERIKGKNVS